MTGITFEQVFHSDCTSGWSDWIVLWRRVKDQISTEKTIQGGRRKVVDGCGCLPVDGIENAKYGEGGVFISNYV